MNSLQELNNWGATPVDYLDNRPSGVVFNRVYPQTAEDQTFDAYASLTVTPTPGIEIVEIINYQTANVRYRVSVKTGSSPTFTGSTITFGTFNSGVTMAQVGDVYTVSGIHSVSDWDSAKNFTWTLPVAFASYPQWYLECTIIYYDSSLAADVEMTWEVYDDRFYNVAALSAESSITAYIGNNSPASAALTAEATIYANPWNQLYGEAALSSEAAFTCEGYVNQTYLDSISTMTINAVKSAVGSAALASEGSVVINGVAAAINLDSRTYLANVGNNIFATNTPQVGSINPTDTISITLSSGIGYFALGNSAAPTATVTISGTKSVVNAQFTGASPIYFYPTKGSSANGTITWAQSRNGTLEFTTTIALTGIANSFAETILTYTTTDLQTWQPTRSQVYYGLFDFLVVGGGGGGGQGGGGGGGDVQISLNQTIPYTVYYILVGSGGTIPTNTWNEEIPGLPIGTRTVNGNNGSTSSIQAPAGGFTNITANGGYGGVGRIVKANSTTYTYTLTGGNSGNATYTGGTSTLGPGFYQNGWPGAGGAGAGANGTTIVNSSTIGNGGVGIISTILNGSSIMYGAGGGGGRPLNLSDGHAVSGAGSSISGGSGVGFVSPTYYVATDGTANTGMGGGGSAFYNDPNGTTTYTTPGAGAAGTVIIKIHA